MTPSRSDTMRRARPWPSPYQRPIWISTRSSVPGTYRPGRDGQRPRKLVGSRRGKFCAGPGRGADSVVVPVHGPGLCDSRGRRCRLQCNLIAYCSKKAVQECRCSIRDAYDLVRGLTIELEIEFGLRPAIVPVGEALEFAP